MGQMSVEEFDQLFEEIKNWGRWGADDVLGTLNLLTPAHVAAFCRLSDRVIRSSRCRSQVRSIEH